MNPTLYTPRLCLRAFRPGDGAALFRYLSDPEVVKFEPYAPFARSEAEREAASRSADDAFWAVCLRDGTLIGNLYAAPEDRDAWAVGWVFARDHWHQGYATEAAGELLRYLFCDRGAHRVHACCDPLNPPSWRLMERLHMRREGLLLQNVWFRRDEHGAPLWKDTYQYALLAEEWNKL